MNNFLKIITGLTLLVAFYALQNPQAIEAIEREKQIYDSLSYAYEATPEEMKQIEDDKKWEKGGKKDEN